MKLEKRSLLLSGVLFLPLIAGLIFFYSCGHDYLDRAINGEHVPLLSDWIAQHRALLEAEDWHKLNQYLFAFTGMYILFGIFLICCFKYWSAIKSIIRNELLISESKSSGIQNRLQTYVIAGLLVILFWGVYAKLGVGLSSIPCYSQEQNIFFGADHLEPIQGWVSFSGEHAHKGSHPLVLLLAVPPTVCAVQLTGDSTLGVIVANSLFAALSVGLCFFLFRKVVSWGNALLLSLVFGFSMSQLFFGALPETYGLASLGIVCTYGLFWLSITRQRLYLAAWVVVGLLTFAVLITNVIQTAICFGFVVWRVRKQEERYPVILTWVSALLALAVPLSLLQKLIMPSSTLFFLPNVFTTEGQYVHTAALLTPIAAVGEVVKHFFLFNIIGFTPNIVAPVPPAVCNALSYFQQMPQFGVSQIISTVLWVVFIGMSVRDWLRSKSSGMLWAIGGAIVFNMALHSLYGLNEMFLYTCDFTFPVLAMVIVRTGETTIFYRVVLLLFLAALVVNNVLMISGFRGMLG